MPFEIQPSFILIILAFLGIFVFWYPKTRVLIIKYSKLFWKIILICLNNLSKLYKIISIYWEKYIFVYFRTREKEQIRGLTKIAIILIIFSFILNSFGLEPDSPQKAVAGYQWTPSGGSVITGSEYNTQDAIANTPSYRALMSSDDVRWLTKYDPAAGLDKRTYIDGVQLQGANKMFITYEGYASDAAGNYTVEIYDNTDFVWRTLNWRGTAFTNTSDSTYTFEIYNGFWQSGGNPVNTPLSRFVTGDANKRVSIRVYSAVTGGRIHYWDRLQVEVGIDPVYYTNSLTKLNGWTGAITNDYTWTNYADDQRMVAANQAGTPLDFYLSYTGIQTYPSANTIFVDFQGSVSNAALTYQLQIYNFTGLSWENLNTTLLANTTETSYYFAKNNVTLADYISANEARIRIYTATGNTYTLSADRVYITVGSTNTDQGLCQVSFGTEAGGTNCSNTRTIDTSSAESTWQQTTATTAAAGYYPGDYAGTWGTNYSASANLSVPITIPDSTAVTGIKYTARFRSNVTTNTMMPSLKDMSGINTSVVGTGYAAPGGWVDVSASNALTTYSTLEPAAYTLSTSSEDFINTESDLANIRMRTSASTATGSVTRDWDFALIAIRWLADDTVAADNPQYVATSGSLQTGTAVAVGATNTASYSGTLNSENYYWQNQNSASGLDVRVNIDGVKLNNANKMIITYEGMVSNAALVYYVQIYDNTNSLWRTLNDRGAALTSITESSYYFSIFNGFWGADTPLSNFITSDANKRVQLRIYSEYKGTAYTQSIDRLQLEVATDPIYWAKDQTVLAGGDGAVTSTGTNARAFDITKDSSYTYAVGYCGNDWCIEKRRISDGSLVNDFGNNGLVIGTISSNNATALAIDATYMYIVGNTGGFPSNFYYEKRNLIDGNLDLGFGTNGVITGDPDSNMATSIVIDNSNMYVIGYDDSNNLRIEKRSLTNGTLDAGFGTNGVITGDPSSNIAEDIAIDNEFMYVVGADDTPDWRIEKRYLSDGDPDVTFGINGVKTSDAASKYAFAIAIDATQMYVVGQDETPDIRIENRLLSDGSLDLTFGLNGVKTSDAASVVAQDIAIDDQYMYLTGSNTTPDWRTEKRLLSDGSYDLGFGTNGVATSASASDYAFGIVIDANDMYIAGSEYAADWQWRVEKRSLSDSSLNTIYGSLNNNYKFTHPAAGSAISTGGSDDQRMTFANPSGASFDYYLTFGNVTKYTGANAILVYYEGNTSTASLTYKIKIYNFTTPGWEDLSSTVFANTSDTAYQFAKAPIANLDDYISDGNIRIGFYTNTTQAGTFSVDYVYATLGSVISDAGNSELTFGATNGGSSSLNSQSIDTSSTSPSTWQINTSNTGANPYASDWAGQYSVNQQATALIDFSTTLGNNTPTTGIRYAFRMLTASTSLTWQGYQQDYSGLIGTVGGWLAAGTTNSSDSTYTYTEGWNGTTFRNNENYLNTFENTLNLKLKPTASTRGTQLTTNWDFAFASLRWYENSANAHYNFQLTPTNSSITLGSDIDPQDAVQNVGSWRAALASDDNRWVIKNDPTAGLDARISLDNIDLNSGNKMMITYEGSVSYASAYYFVQIYDNVSSVWRTLNDREVALNNTTETSPYYFSIFNGYWNDGGGSVNAPLSNFITNDANKRVQIRFYSTTNIVGFTLAIDRVQAEVATDPVYWPSNFNLSSGSDGIMDGVVASDSIRAMAKDTSYMYVVGNDSTPDWRVEKRSLISGSLDTGFGTNGVATGASASNWAYAIAIDANFMYVAGGDSTPDLRIEKRRLSDGSLDVGFGTNGVVTGASSSNGISTIAIDSTYMYVAGWDSTPNWRIEKRSLSNGSLDLGFGNNGVITSDSDGDYAQAIAIDTNFMYVAGITGAPNWRIEKRSLSDGSLDLGFGTNGVIACDPASNDLGGIAVAAGFMYIAGFDDTFNWRIEKRNLSDGTPDNGFGTNGVVTGDPASNRAYAIAIDATYMYVAGRDENTKWRIEKRNLSDGTPDNVFGTNGVVTGDVTSFVAFAITIDASKIYTAGSDWVGNWHIDKRALSDGALDTSSGSGFGNVDYNTYKATHPIATTAISSGGSDDQYLAVQNISGQSFDFYLTFGNVATYTGANALFVYYEGKTSAAGLTYKIKIYNFTTPGWEDLSATVFANTTDTAYQFAKAPIANLDDYISGGNIRIGFYTPSTTAGSFSIDYLYLMPGSVIDNAANSEISFGTEAGGTAATGTQSLDTSLGAGAENYWGVTTATTATNPYFGDWSGTYSTNDNGAANISFPVTMPANAKVTNTRSVARYLSNSAANTIEYAFKDYGGALGTTGGWVDPGAVSNNSSTYSINYYRQTTNPEDFINTSTNKMNMKIRTTASTDANLVTYRWDFAFVTFAWTTEEDHPSGSHQFTGTGGSLEVGIGMALSSTNYGSWRGTLASDNGYWQNQNSASGLDVRVSIDGVKLNNANKMIITYEGMVSNAALTYYVQIYDNTAGFWRTLNDRGALLTSTTESTYYFSIFDGFWGSSTPLSNFITSDANKRVQLRIYSEYTGTAYTQSVDRFQLEVATDPVYWAKDQTVLAGGDGVITSAADGYEATDVAKDDTYMYVFGNNESFDWRVEKRKLSDGTLDVGFGNNGVVSSPGASNYAEAITIDSTYMYIVGSNWTTEDKIRVEKRRLSDGSLDMSFGTNGVILGDSSSSYAYAIDVDSTYMYIVGTDDTPDWRIEKRYLSDGSLDLSFGNNGIITCDPLSYAALAIIIDNNFMYITGRDETADWRIEKRALSNGDLDLGFGDQGVITGDPAGFAANNLAINDTYMYVVGNIPTPDWRIEKRALLDGSLDLSFGNNGVISGDPSSNTPYDITIDSNYMYVTGDQWAAGYDWRIEKRALSDGAPDLGFGTNGVITGDVATYRSYGIVKDSNDMYVVGGDGSDWRIEKRALSNGALNTIFGSLNNNYKFTHPAAGSAISTGGSDDQKLAYVNPSGASFDYYLTFGNVATYTGANAILVYYEGMTSTASLTYKLKIYNFTNLNWEDLSSTALVNTADTAYQFAKAPIANLDDYIQGGNIRIGFYTSTTQAGTFSVDYIYATLGSVISDAGNAQISFGSTDGSSALNTQNLDASLASPAVYGVNTATTAASFYANDYAPGLYNVAQNGAANINFNITPTNNTFVTGIRYAARYRSNSTLLTVQPNVFDYSGLLGVSGGWLAVGTTNALTTYTYSEGFHNATNNNAWGFNNDLSNMRLRTTASTLGTQTAMGWDFAFMSIRWSEVERIVTVGTTGTQTADMDIPSSNNYVGGAFTFIRDASTANITSITISETGSVSANANLANLDLYYETADICNYNGNETLFGTAANFNASEKATVTGTMAVGTSQICVYPVLDVGAGTENGQIMEIEITNPSTDVVVSSGIVSPDTVVAIAGLTTLGNNPPNNPANLVQLKTDNTVISTGGWTNETSVKYTATVTDPNNDQIRLCVEKDPLGTGFSGTEDACGDLVASGSTANVTISTQTDNTQYHWQARAKDDQDEYSSWVSYGGNGENERDYGLDASPPTNDSLTFTNPYAGVGNSAVADDTTSWNFQAKVTELAGVGNIDYVEIRFANSSDNTQPYDSLKLRWTEATDTFTEITDVQDTAIITSIAADSNAVDNQWTLDFKIKFNNNFSLKDTNYNVELYAVDDLSNADNDDYSNLYQVTALSLSLNLDSNSLDFGSLAPGTPKTSTSISTVTTNAPNGYDLKIHDDIVGNNSSLRHTDLMTYIMDYLGTINAPTPWSGTGLGICVYSATNKEAKWGLGISEADINNRYAGIPQVTATIHNKTSSPTLNDQTRIGYKLDVPNTQKPGTYSGNVTFTATALLF